MFTSIRKCLKDMDEETKDMLIEVLKNDEITDKLINNMLDLLKSLAKDYPKNINVKER